MKKTTFKRIAASIAALCICSMAVAPVVADAYTIVVKDTSSTIDLSQKTFAAYKIFSVNVIGSGADVSYGYTVEDKWVDFIAKYFELDKEASDFDAQAAGKMVATGFDKNAFAEAAYEYASATDTAIAADYTTTTYAKDSSTGEETATFTGTDGSMPNGYYMVADTTTGGGAVSAVMLNQIDGTTTSDVTITLKADQPTITKKIVEGDKRVDANTATIGDTVTYELKTFVPDDTEYYDEYAFVITDTIDPGLDFDTASVVIKVGDKTLVSPTDYVVYFANTDDADDGDDDHLDKMTIRFNTINDLGYTQDLAGQDLIVTVDATVNEDAKIGTEGNENDVKLTFSNNPNVSGDGKLYNDDDQDTDGDGTPDDTDTDDDNDGTPDDTDTDDDNDGTPDTDEPTKDNPDNTSEEDTPWDTVVTYLAKFSILKVNDAGTTLPGATFTVTNTAANYEETFVTGDDGLIVVSGIEAGTYTIEETIPPAGGYNKLDSTFTITVGCTVNDVVLPDANEAIEYYPTGSTAGTNTCVWDVSTSGNALATEDATQDAVIKVVNKAGTVFPTTGGIGTTIFTVVGVSLMAGAAGAFAIKRKAMNK